MLIIAMQVETPQYLTHQRQDRVIVTLEYMGTYLAKMWNGWAFLVLVAMCFMKQFIKSPKGKASPWYAEFSCERHVGCSLCVVYLLLSSICRL